MVASILFRFRKVSIVFLTVLFSLISHVVFADTVQGRVQSVNSSTLNLAVYDAQGRMYPNVLRLNVDGYTRLDSVSSLTALRPQDAVRVDVSQERSGQWRAEKITRLRSNAVVPASKPITETLKDSLTSPAGQKIIRGGLAGAITGAVASGASGGKAGKGALIGAGVGALGGLLENILTGGQGNRQAVQTSGSSAGVATQEDYRY